MSARELRRAILDEIAAIGPVLPGSIVERTTRCQTEGCHYRADPPQLHGPYFAWTHRSGGHQVTTTITAVEADALRPLVVADRRLHGSSLSSRDARRARGRRTAPHRAITGGVRRRQSRGGASADRLRSLLTGVLSVIHQGSSTEMTHLHRQNSSCSVLRLYRHGCITALRQPNWGRDQRGAAP
jgi:hypothetical protein